MGPIPREATRAAYSEENREKKKKNSFCSEMANVKLIFLFSLVIAIGLSSGFELGKNQKQKSAVKQKMGSMIVKAKSAKQFKELKRQNNIFPWGDGPSIHDGFELGKNQKQKSAVKQKLGSMIVKAKSAKQFKELKR